MKKIIILFCAFCMTSMLSVHASDMSPQDLNSPVKKKITFIYIHGSNDFSGKNRLEFKKHFYKQVHQMHPYMLKAFNGDALIRHKLLKDGQYEINTEPEIFYWGDKSFQEVVNIDDNLNVATLFSPKLPQIVRGAFAHCLHDAVWVQKYPNMSQIIDELHMKVKAETDKGNQVILLGYSAGSFITYEYFLNKFISINPEELVANTEYDEMNKLLGKGNIEPTCLDALLESGIVTLDMSGRYKPNLDKNTVLNNYPKLNEKTKSVCFQDGSVDGVINFASPLALFYSDVSDDKSDLNFLSKLMYKHIIETDVFWLTVNYLEDPLGFPTSKNLTPAELSVRLTMPMSPKGGFVYDKSDVRSHKSFITAHLAYWSTQKRFSKAVVEAFNKGYINFYGKPESL